MNETAILFILCLMILSALINKVYHTWRRHAEMNRRKREAEEQARQERERALEERLDREREGYYQAVRGLQEALAPSDPGPPSVFLNGTLLLEGADYWWSDRDGHLRMEYALRARDIVQVHRGEQRLTLTLTENLAQGEIIPIEPAAQATPVKVPESPPEGWVEVKDMLVRPGAIVTKRGGEKCRVVEIKHVVRAGHPSVIWAKLEPLPEARSAWDRLLDEDGAL